MVKWVAASLWLALFMGTSFRSAPAAHVLSRKPWKRGRISDEPRLGRQAEGINDRMHSQVPRNLKHSWGARSLLPAARLALCATCCGDGSVAAGALGPRQEARGVGEQDRGCRWAPRVPTVLPLWGQCDCGTKNPLYASLNPPQAGISFHVPGAGHVMFLFAALRSSARRRAVTGRQGNEGGQEEAVKLGMDVLSPPPPCVSTAG